MSEKVLCVNKRAFHDYTIEEIYEAGMVLLGTEVKSLRLGKANLKDSYVRIEDGEAFLHNMHISPYPFGHQFNHDPERKRKLLLHKREIRRLLGKIQERGYTLIPLKIYLKNGIIKMELGLAKGKTLHDKREDLKRRAAEREIEKTMKVVKYHSYCSLIMIIKRGALRFRRGSLRQGLHAEVPTGLVKKVG